MSREPYRVLFLCTGNSARSILAESILNRVGEGRFQAYSAGSMPTGKVNPNALKLLQSMGYPTEGLRSKSWDEFATDGAPALDLIITVCDNAAGEVCPIWPGKPVRGHWGLPDPAAVEGDELAKARAFEETHRVLHRLIVEMTALPMEKLDEISMREIGARKEASA